MMKLKFLALSFVLVLFIPAIPMTNSLTTAVKKTHTVTQERDYWPTDGWLTSTPDEHGMNSNLFDDLVEIASPLRSFLVIRNGYILYEYYRAPDNSASVLQPIFSVTKSFMSALVGMTLDSGNLTSLGELVVDLFPDRTIANLDEDKQSITVEHLISMTSGFEWDVDTDPDAMRDSPDWIQYTLDKPMAETPGETYRYNTGNSHLLSAIINHTTGILTQTYANSHLFQPLGISDYEWRYDPQGLSEGGSGLNLTARDMAKIGFLWLNNGTWDGEQLVSSSWVAASTQVQAPESNYGYQWRIDPTVDAYYAFGYRSLAQYVWVQPKNDLIVVFTVEGLLDMLDVIRDYILPAIIPPETATSSLTTTATNTTNGTLQNYLPLIIGLSASGVVIIAVLTLFFLKKRG